MPYLRGHGTTTFVSRATFRDAQRSAVALDIVASLDALRTDQAVLAGFDRGSRTADIIAALWPERCRALVSVTGYPITNRERRRRAGGPGGPGTTSPPNGAGRER
ncbi:alpha/beta fold hydrolase [Streptomyces sp. NPDC060000]|uniref:alpha/beta fold hydrolase n=1 Tax=Streptomyces sp. NPDC060000 TaxID=3347031 RepID=UPI003679FCA7